MAGEEPSIETLILANHVEAINGLLYVSGGGWTDHWRPQPPQPGAPVFSHIGIAIAVLVPAAAAGLPHQLTVQVEDGFGQPVPGAGLSTQINAGRAPGLPPGADQRAVLALTLNLVFPGPGEYRVTARVGQAAARTVGFRVHDIPPPAAEAPQVN